MSCSFLIWSSLAMSANSSKKPSKLLQEKKKVVGEVETKEGNIGDGQQEEFKIIMD